MKPLFLFCSYAILAGAILAGCTSTPATPVAAKGALAASTPPPPVLGYAYDAKLAVGASWLAYLNSGKASKAVVAQVDPFYRAASAALKAWSDAVLAGTATGTEPATVTTAFQALTAAMTAAGIPTTLPAG